MVRKATVKKKTGSSKKSPARRPAKSKVGTAYPSWVMPVVIGGCTLIAGIALGWGYGLMTRGMETAPTVRLEAPAVASSTARAPQISPAVQVPTPSSPTQPPPTAKKEPTSSPVPEASTAASVAREPEVSMPDVVREKTSEPSAPAPVMEKVPEAPSQVAALTTPPPPVSYTYGNDNQQPPWLRYAVATPYLPEGKPLVAVVIDDMGVDRRRTEKIIALPGPLTTAFLPYASDLSALTTTARARGHELLVHVPMEPLKMRGNNPGPGVLMVGQGKDSIRQRLDESLSRFDSFVGINNHMGSRFTSDTEGMKVVAEELRNRGLLFLDSVTSDKTVAARVTRQAGVPTVSRTIFLDNVNETNAVLQQLTQLEHAARKAGYAIAIGHPRDGTISALAHWLPTLKDKGFILVPVSAIAKKQNPPS